MFHLLTRSTCGKTKSGCTFAIMSRDVLMRQMVMQESVASWVSTSLRQDQAQSMVLEDWLMHGLTVCRLWRSVEMCPPMNNVAIQEYGKPDFKE